jgi:hypothetical protein
LNRPPSAFVAAWLLLWLAVSAAAQVRQVWLVRRGQEVHVRSAGVNVITGGPLARLKDGHALNLVLDAAIGASSDGTFVPAAARRFVLSYDLWEERFAVTHADPPRRGISHLTAVDASSWCVEELTVSLPPANRQVLSAPFWLRLTYRIDDEDRSGQRDTDNGFTLRGLIDRLSRRKGADSWSDTILSGPLRLGE